jgi:hypothetical protein
MKALGKNIAFCILLIPILAGCGLAARVLLGVDSTPNWKSDSEIAKQAKRYKIPEDVNLVLDTGAYYNGLHEIYTGLVQEFNVNEKDSMDYVVLNKVSKDDSQSTQFRLFDKNGVELFKIVNCYIDPPIPMRWNVDGCFDTFPPVIDTTYLNFHYYDLDFLLRSSSTLDDRKIALTDLAPAEYYGVIMWNDFMQRPSRKSRS